MPLLSPDHFALLTELAGRGPDVHGRPVGPTARAACLADLERWGFVDTRNPPYVVTPAGGFERLAYTAALSALTKLTRAQADSLSAVVWRRAHEFDAAHYGELLRLGLVKLVGGGTTRELRATRAGEYAHDIDSTRRAEAAADAEREERRREALSPRERASWAPFGFDPAGLDEAAAFLTELGRDRVAGVTVGGDRGRAVVVFYWEERD